MEPMLMLDIDLDDRNDEELLVQEWRVCQLRRLGLPGALAEAFAHRVDWHQIADLVERGCPPELALEIAR
jgi:hypothetical protein